MEFHQRMTALSTVTDAGLVARCRDGDDDAWEELVRRFSRYVLAIAQQAYRLSPADAEDVFQDVFARTYERLGDLRNDDAVRPWIAQLTRRLCIDRIRAGSRESADPEALRRQASTTASTGWTRRCRCRRRCWRCRTTAATSSTASSDATRATP